MDTEHSPLLQSRSNPKPPKNVSFNTNVTTSGPSTQPARAPPPSLPLVPKDGGGQPMLAKLRRRSSMGAPLVPQAPPLPKAGAQRTTKTAQKLKLLPNPNEDGDGEEDEESGRDVYSQFTRIKDPTARRDAARLGKEDREKLPRVTAYCTANEFRMDDLMRFLKGRGKGRGANPKRFDECIYTPYRYSLEGEPASVETPSHLKTGTMERRFSDSAVEIDHTEQRREDLIDMHTETAGQLSLDNGEENVPNHTAVEMEQPQEPRVDTLDFDTQVHVPEVFLFEYGTVVIWGMSVKDEERFLKDISKFEKEKLSKDDVQTENFNFYYTREYQARIYNDFISLREKRSYMTKLAISHALSQSVKTSLYEDLVDNTIENTKDIPSQIATTGKVQLSRKETNMQIGELFILRINIHLQGSVLDSPELMWAEPHLDPIYQAARSYLEMDQRVGLLTERIGVIGDLLSLLKDQLTHYHGETLEWIVIILIAMEIAVAAVNIIVDVYAGVD